MPYPGGHNHRDETLKMLNLGEIDELDADTASTEDIAEKVNEIIQAMEEVEIVN